VERSDIAAATRPQGAPFIVRLAVLSRPANAGTAPAGACGGRHDIPTAREGSFFVGAGCDPGDMQLTAADIERIPRDTIRVPKRDFVELWIAAERDVDADPMDWYAVGIVMTCEWLAGATVRPPTVQRPHLAYAPVSGRERIPMAEDVVQELQDTEVAAIQRPNWVASRGEWIDAVVATLNWAWRRQAPPVLPSARPGTARS
jgi:hypothetical protein